jgi:hypothetical protein
MILVFALAACATVPAKVARSRSTDEIVIPPPEPGAPPSQDPTQEHEPRDLGYRAALHVYWYAPQTLEITHVETFLYTDEEKCESSIGKALMIAAPYASDGDLVAGKCIALQPPAKDSAGTTL